MSRAAPQMDKFTYKLFQKVNFQPEIHKKRNRIRTSMDRNSTIEGKCSLKFNAFLNESLLFCHTIMNLKTDAGYCLVTYERCVKEM